VSPAVGHEGDRVNCVPHDFCEGDRGDTEGREDQDNGSGPAGGA
jgi:hypothetical protein